MITSNFFVDFKLIKDGNRIDSMVNSLAVDDRKDVREALEYLNGVIRKYADDEGYNMTMSKNAFAISMWMLRYINEPGMTSRFTITQRDVFARELENISKEANENILPYCDSSGIEAGVDGNTFYIPFDFFIKNNKKISGYKYRLVYQKLNKGIIHLTKTQFIHLLREDFVQKLMDAYSSMSPGDSQNIFRKFITDLDKLKKDYLEIKSKNTISLGEVDFTMFPPCIKTYITQMRDGENLAHLARFTLASFLHNAGMSNENIMNILKFAPDYKEDLAMYQVNHITGVISGTEYSPPKCSTLKSNHLCYMGDDLLCNDTKYPIKHPMQYYERKKKRSKNNMNK
jgi:DNA primase large subunit